MGKRLLVEPGVITAGDISRILSTPARLPAGWGDLPKEEVVAHIRGYICSEEDFTLLDWHIMEVPHANNRRHALLKWPLVGSLVRDQHEINRLLLISLEKSLDMLARIELELGRLFGYYRLEDRGYWVKRYRYLGTQWNAANKALGGLRILWEEGRRSVFRLRSKAGQAAMDAFIETGLCALSEALSALMELASSEQVSKRIAERGDSNREPFFPDDLDGHVKSCLWHAQEGRALRHRWGQSSPVWRVFQENQKKLNRVYSISLEEMSFLLKELSLRLSRVRMQMEARISDRME